MTTSDIPALTKRHGDAILALRGLEARRAALEAIPDAKLRDCVAEYVRTVWAQRQAKIKHNPRS